MSIVKKLVTEKIPFLLIDDESGEGMATIGDLSSDNFDREKANIMAYVAVLLDDLKKGKHASLRSLHFKRWEMTQEDFDALTEQ